MDLNSLLNSNQTALESPKENTCSRWREIHGSTDWNNLLDPLHPWLRREIIKYGEFAQATYDAFDFDPLSEFCGSCLYNRRKIFDKLGLSKHGYMVSKYIYAMSHVDLPHWLQWTHLMDTWSNDSNWMGFVGFSNDEESHRIGRRDILVAWRGTIAACEWYKDFEMDLIPIGDGDAKVEHGFHDIYTSKMESTRYNKSSASEQVMQQVTRLVNLYRTRGDEVSLTITGHSLGGALALLTAYEAAKAIPDLVISVISFGGPKVGNKAFKEKLHEMGVKVLRVVVKQDKVPMMPMLPTYQYTHVGTELKLDIQASPYLKKSSDLAGFHSLETYLHLVDGFQGTSLEFRLNTKRDLALVNKYCAMLVDELKIPKCWFQLPNKGMVLNSYGKWVRPKRELEDIPSTELRYFFLCHDT